MNIPILLQTLRLRFRLWRLRKQIQKASPHKPERLLCLNLLMILDPILFQYYNPIIGQSRFILSPFPNIEDYTKKLIQTIRLIKKEQTIPSDWWYDNNHHVSIDRFFIATEGYYFNPAIVVMNLKLAGIELCQLMEKSDSAEYGLDEHNLRMLTKMFVNVRNLTFILIDISLQPKMN